MPTYEYVCRACRHEFERFQPITAEAIKLCPKCKRRRVERKIGIGAGVLFKGGGFYETDYRSESYRKSEDAEKKESEKKTVESAKATAGITDGSNAPTGRNAEPSAAKPTDTSHSKAAPTAPISPTDTTTKDAIKPSPVNQEKKSAREGRGFGNLKQSAAPRAKPPRRASKPARKNTHT